MNIISVTTPDESAWLAVVQKDRQVYHVFKLEFGTTGGLHKSLLGDALLVFSVSESALRDALRRAYPEFREGTQERR